MERTSAEAIHSYRIMIEVAQDGSIQSTTTISAGSKCIPLRVKVTDVAEMLSIGESTVWEKINPKHKSYDEGFPAPIRDGNSTFWLITDIMSYIEHLELKRNIGSEKVELYRSDLDSCAVNKTPSKHFDDKEFPLQKLLGQLQRIEVKPIVPIKGGKYYPLLLRVKEVARLLNASEGTIWNFNNSKSGSYAPDFPTPVKLAGSTRWVAEEVFSYIEKLKDETLTGNNLVLKAVPQCEKNVLLTGGSL